MCEQVIIRFSPEIEQALLVYLLSNKHTRRKDPIKPTVKEYLTVRPNEWINRENLIEATGIKNITTLQSVIASLRYRGLKVESGRRGAGMYRYVPDSSSGVAAE